MCTVGYGDNYPSTAGGKTIGVLVMLCGIIVLAFPLTILSGNFMGEWMDFLQVKEKRELKKLEKELKKAAKDTKGKELSRIPPPTKILKAIWTELISLKYGIDSCYNVIETCELQFKKIQALVTQLELSVKHKQAKDKKE